MSLSPPCPYLTNDLHVSIACEPPPEFPLASPCTGIDHHLSGTNAYALTQTTHLSSWSADGVGKHLTFSLTTTICVVSLSFRLFAFHKRVFHPTTRIHVRLLGPCFKTGPMEAFALGHHCLCVSLCKHVTLDRCCCLICFPLESLCCVCLPNQEHKCPQPEIHTCKLNPSHTHH